ncbi:protein NETWORKED 4A [Sesamum alatum]|uniref:Protein NETWORKED 4A n=1 Tax=Sesamum alatum TaxID=300844 RepID=A0AAE1XXG4_9LAMI|nr:protein NETWORKED 4A [Sesamum alatum]
MASTVKSNRLNRSESKKSHSWLWDSHISPKNSKWLQENLQGMDQHVKRMLKLIETDADSFAKKAEMYYQKRPELISLVEDFYRMYRSLAERYDHVTGELRKNIPSDLQSQCSGISDIGSEPPSTMPSPDRRPTWRKSGPRAPGFEFFLGSGGAGSDLYNKEGDESSTLDSGTESDDSSVHNYSGSMPINYEEQGLRRRIIELEVELREVKEKLLMQEDETPAGSSNKIAKHEEELRRAKEKIQQSEEEISRLTIELRKYKFLGDSNSLLLSEDVVRQNGPEVLEPDAAMEGSEGEVLDPVNKIQMLEEELRITQERLHEAEEEATSLRQELMRKGSVIQNLQDQITLAQKEVSLWKNKLEKEKREVVKVQDRVSRYKTNLSERDQEIRGLKEAMSNANKSLSEENEKLQAEVASISKERTYLEDNLKGLDLRCQSLEEDVRRVKAGKAETEAVLGSQIEQLKAEISDKNECLEELKLKYEKLMAEKDELNANIAALDAEMSCKDDRIDQMSEHFRQLHEEHADLIARAEGARKSVEELGSRVKELEREVERKEDIIREGAEEKREAIRQLCFSLEHYRNGYYRLREAVVGQKKTPLMAS